MFIATPMTKAVQAPEERNNTFDTHCAPPESLNLDGQVVYKHFIPTGFNVSTELARKTDSATEAISNFRTHYRAVESLWR